MQIEYIEILKDKQIRFNITYLTKNFDMIKDFREGYLKIGKTPKKKHQVFKIKDLSLSELDRCSIFKHASNFTTSLTLDQMLSLRTFYVTHPIEKEIRTYIWNAYEIGKMTLEQFCKEYKIEQNDTFTTKYYDNVELYNKYKDVL